MQLPLYNKDDYMQLETEFISHQKLHDSSVLLHTSSNYIHTSNGLLVYISFQLLVRYSSKLIFLHSIFVLFQLFYLSVQQQEEPNKLMQADYTDKSERKE